MYDPHVSLSAVSLRCEACGHVPARLVDAPYPFVCERAGDGADHLVAPCLDRHRAVFPTDEGRPFVRFRHLLHAHAAALALGLGDQGYLAIEERLHRALIEVDRRGFVTTPLLRGEFELPHEVWIKDETNDVGGSHKGRHLFGVLLHLEVVRAAGLESSPAPRLAIASCGNAALAAAVLARAANRALAVMVPTDAHPNVLARLEALGADVRVCAREDGVLGDPTVAAFRAAVAEGALPFACQGPECGLTLDGGKTLGFEIVAQQAAPFDRVFVQVGGGALGSSLARAFDDAMALGALTTRPRFMTVQTAAVAPLAAAYERIVEVVRARTFHPLPERGDALADALRDEAVAPLVEAVLAEVVVDRPHWLPIWPRPGHSAAHGILDDETYDAVALLRAMFTTGGWPIVVDEATVLEAESLGRSATSIDVDATGTAGFAGLLAWSRAHEGPPERTLALFTGARR